MPWHQLPFCWAIRVHWAVNVLLLDVIDSKHSRILVVPIPLRAGLLITPCPGMSPSSLEAGLNLRGNWRTELLLSWREKEGLQFAELLFAGGEGCFQVWGCSCCAPPLAAGAVPLGTATFSPRAQHLGQAVK